MKIFVLISRIPYPLEKGDKLRIFYQLQELAKNHSIYLCALNDAKEHPEAKEILLKFCKEVHFITLSPIRIEWNILKALFSWRPFQVGYFYNCKSKKQIDTLIQRIQPDHIYCQLIRVAEYVKHIRHIPKTLDYQDAFSKGIERRIKNDVIWFLKPIFRMEYLRMRNYEVKTFDWFTHKTIISKQDREFIHHPEKDKIHVIRNGVSLTAFKAIGKEKTFDLMFSGNMNYPPNVVGAVYIAKEILPLIHLKYPNVKLLIAGANPAKQVQALQSAHVEVTGWVDDMSDCYAISKIFIAPMQIGIGLQNKLLEAMAMKLPCIASDLTNQSLGAVDGKEILIGTTPQQYANHFFDLIENETFALNISQAGYQFVYKNFNWEAVTKQLESVFISSYRQA